MDIGYIYDTTDTDYAWIEDYAGGYYGNYAEWSFTAGVSANYTIMAIDGSGNTNSVIVNGRTYYGPAEVSLFEGDFVTVQVYHDGTGGSPKQVFLYIVPEGGQGSKQEYYVSVDFSVGIDGNVWGAPNTLYGTAYSAGGSVTLTIPNDVPYRYDGYTFQYWTDGYNRYYPGDTITIIAPTTPSTYTRVSLSPVWSNGTGGGDNPSTTSGSISGINTTASSYTVTATNLDSSKMSGYYMMIADINSDGTVNYYYARRGTVNGNTLTYTNTNSSSSYTKNERPIYLVYGSYSDGSTYYKNSFENDIVASAVIPAYGQSGSGKCWIYNGTTWVSATPYIYNGTSWVQATPYVYDGGWK